MSRKSAAAASSAPVRPWGRWGLRSTAIAYLVLAVALPLAAVVERGFGAGLAEFWKQVTAPTALDALRLTLFLGAVMTAVNNGEIEGGIIYHYYYFGDQAKTGENSKNVGLYYFRNGGAPNVYLSSADWMGRNLFRRIEIAWPVLDPKLRKRVVDEGLTPYLEDVRDAWLLQPDGEYRPPKASTGSRSAQHELLARLAASAGEA